MERRLGEPNADMGAGHASPSRAFIPGLVVVAFWWVAVVAFHHYDSLYRALQDSAAPRWLTFVGLGWDGRSIVVAVLVLSGADVLVPGLGIGAAALAIWFVLVASVQWLTVQREGRR